MAAKKAFIPGEVHNPYSPYGHHSHYTPTKEDHHDCFLSNTGSTDIYKRLHSHILKGRYTNEPKTKGGNYFNRAMDNRLSIAPQNRIPATYELLLLLP